MMAPGHKNWGQDGRWELNDGYQVVADLDQNYIWTDLPEIYDEHSARDAARALLQAANYLHKENRIRES